MFKPKAIYFENKILEYPLGKKLMEKYKEIPKIEIENLKGITEQRCKNTKYYFYDWYCQYCSNLNCNSNKNNEVV